MDSGRRIVDVSRVTGGIVAARAFAAISALAVAVCGGCASGTSSSALPQAVVPGISPMTRSLASNYIKHVVVIIQENRSFENFFAGYPKADAPMWGYGLKHGRRVKIPLHQDTFQVEPDLAHIFASAIIDWDNGKMDGFYQPGPSGKGAAYAYIEREQVQPYWDIAKQYVLADHMFPTEFGGSWTAHITLVAGTDNVRRKPLWALVGPSLLYDSCAAPPGAKSDVINRKRKVLDGVGPFPCFTQFNTMAQDLDQNGVSWKYYVDRTNNAATWSPFEAIKYVRRGPDWRKDVVHPETQVLTDAKNGTLAQVSWVTPSLTDSDHPASHSDKGPSWVSSIVNAVGKGPDWSSTAIVLLWDDWGGFYDNVPPPQLDFRGLSIRVPCLIISPYAKTNYVDKTQYEYGSILKFMEEAFNLPPIGPRSAWQGYTDTRANSLDNAFNFSQPARGFTPIQAKYPAIYFLTMPRSNLPVDTE
ncbi:MAG TPA: alkaline phosphatase family protein [Candidatus Cybelea sp.]